MSILATKLTSKGQITIPKKIRDVLGFHEGDTLVFMSEDGKLTIKKAELVVLEEGQNGQSYNLGNG